MLNPWSQIVGRLESALDPIGLRGWGGMMLVAAMDREAITIYMNDHLAGADIAVGVLERLCQHRGLGLAGFAERLLTDVHADREVLIHLIERVGAPSSPKRLAGRLSAVFLHAKFQVNESPLGTFEALELLALGILGKASLWRALMTIADNHPMLRGIQLGVLLDRAMDQHARVESKRLELAPPALAAAFTGSLSM